MILESRFFRASLRLVFVRVRLCVRRFFEARLDLCLGFRRDDVRMPFTVLFYLMISLLNLEAKYSRAYEHGHILHLIVKHADVLLETGGGPVHHLSTFLHNQGMRMFLHASRVCARHDRANWVALFDL